MDWAETILAGVCVVCMTLLGIDLYKSAREKLKTMRKRDKYVWAAIFNPDVVLHRESRPHRQRQDRAGQPDRRVVRRVDGRAGAARQHQNQVQRRMKWTSC